MSHLTLAFEKRTKIGNPGLGLKEPSGLTFSSADNLLWTVSDDKAHIFALKQNGAILEDKSFSIDVHELEGIALDPSGKALFTVSEKGNRLTKFTLPDKQPMSVKLEALSHYADLASLFDKDEDNKGLEGICVLARDEGLLLLKEARPRLLVHISADLNEIKGCEKLTRRKGFRSSKVSQKKLDVSGLCSHEDEHTFWIVSDQGKRLFLYDRHKHKVRQSFALAYKKGGKTKRIKKAEGVAYDPTERRLYVASDTPAFLYQYQVRQN